MYNYCGCGQVNSCCGTNYQRCCNCCMPKCCDPVIICRQGPTGPIGSIGPTGPIGPIGPTGATGTTQVSSLINSINTATQALAAGADVVFTTNTALIGTDISHLPNTSTFTINTPGTYLLNYGVTVTGSAGAVYPLDTSVSVFSNGVEIPGSSSGTVLQAATDEGNLANSVIFTALPGQTITLVNGTDNTSYTNANINITKLY